MNGSKQPGFIITRAEVLLLLQAAEEQSRKSQESGSKVRMQSQDVKAADL